MLQPWVEVEMLLAKPFDRVVIEMMEDSADQHRPTLVVVGVDAVDLKGHLFRRLVDDVARAGTQQ